MQIMNPYFDASKPFTTFIPYMLDMSVGAIRMMLSDVRVRMVVFMLLLMMLEYVSIVDSKMSE